MDVGMIIDKNKRKLSSAEVIFMTVMTNPKQRFEFSKPVYVPYVPANRRESLTKYRGEIYYIPSIYIRARQGHTQSSSPTAGMELVSDSNLPRFALYGTSSKNIETIMKYGLTPGGEVSGISTGTGRQCVHMASTLPGSNSEIVSGYRTGSQICINVDIKSYIEEGGQIWRSGNRVLNSFKPIDSRFFLCAIDTANGWDYVTNTSAKQDLLNQLQPVLSLYFSPVQKQISRERVSVIEQVEQLQHVPEALVDLRKEVEAMEADDRDMIDPVNPEVNPEYSGDVERNEPIGKQQENLKAIIEEGH